MDKIKIGVIGIGEMGKNHARVYNELPQCELVAVADTNNSLIILAEKFKCNFYSDYKKMLENEKIDAVSIVTPTSTHYPIFVDVIKSNMHILIEKPVSNNISEANKMLNLSKKIENIILVGHIERFNPAIIQLKRIIQSKKLGDIITIIARRVGLYPPRVKDVNIVVDVSIHDIDIARFLLDEEPTIIYSSASNILDSSREDQNISFLKFKNTDVILQTNWITPIKIRNLSVTGTKGYAELDYIIQELTVYKSNYKKEYGNYGEFTTKFGKSSKEEIRIQKKEPLKVEIKHFLNCIRYNKIPLVTLQEAVKSLKIALEINKNVE